MPIDREEYRHLWDLSSDFLALGSVKKWGYEGVSLRITGIVGNSRADSSFSSSELAVSMGIVISTDLPRGFRTSPYAKHPASIGGRLRWNRGKDDTYAGSNIPFSRCRVTCA